MPTTKFFLDKRAVKAGKAAPLKIMICHERQLALISLGVHIMPEQWDDKAEKVVKHPNRMQLNSFIISRKSEVDRAILFLMGEEIFSGMRAKDIKDYVTEKLNPKKGKIEPDAPNPNTLGRWFKQFTNHKNGRTKGIYDATYRRLTEFCAGLDELTFEQVNKDWLQRFDDFMAKKSPSANARNIHLRNIRAVFNDAIDNEITRNYPFRRFKIKAVPTRKRNFTVDTIREIFNVDGLEKWQERYLDLFKLTFMLIGINVVDLCNLKEVRDGRVDYIRAKTHKPYSIKVEPEAMAIIEKYRGKKYLLSYLDTNKNYRCFYMNVCRGLAAIKERLNENGVDIKELTTYWARHSWATIAASLDIPKDTIAAALGHGGNTVTDIYIEFDMSKVDVANRRVLDWALYGKR